MVLGSVKSILFVEQGTYGVKQSTVFGGRVLNKGSKVLAQIS